MKQRMLFIYNANAGKGRIKSQLSDIVEDFCRAGYEITIYATGARKEATQMVLEQGSDYDVVVCSGGDGTINEVITALMQLDNPPKCGYIPAGTVNDFATSLKIPKTPINAAHVITAGNVYRCDIGSFGDKYFNYVAAFGAFTEVAYETPQNIKNALGKAAYFLDAVKVLPTLHGYNMKLECDGRIIEGNYIFGMVCNSQFVGGFSLGGKKYHNHLDDGVFEVVMISTPTNPLELQRAINALISRDITNPFIDAIRASHIHVVCEEGDVQWTLDGEDGGIADDVEIHDNYRAIEIFSPKKNHKPNKKSEKLN